MASQHRTNSPYQLEAELVLRLPAERLQPVLDELPRLAEHIDYQHLDSRIVTEEAHSEAGAGTDQCLAPHHTIRLHRLAMAA